VTRHLVQFAARDGLIVDWSEPVSGDQLQIIDPVVTEYLVSHSSPANELLGELAAETRAAAGGAAGMQIGADEGAARPVGEAGRHSTGDRGRRVHRLLVPVHRARPARRWSAARL